MNTYEKDKEECVKIITSDKNWIVSDAIEQLKSTAKLLGMYRVVGLPDLHPGKNTLLAEHLFLKNGYTQS